MTKRIIVTGPPNSGKTTFFEGLRVIYPEAPFMPEPATCVIEEELSKEETDPNYEGRLPERDYRRFAPLVIAKSLELELAVSLDAHFTIQDRSLVDTVGYARLNGCFDLVSGVQKLIAEAGYTAALMCSFVGKYETTRTRMENLEKAQQTQAYLLEAYEESGIAIIQIPPVSQSERLSIARGVIDSL